MNRKIIRNLLIIILILLVAFPTFAQDEIPIPPLPDGFDTGDAVIIGGGITIAVVLGGLFLVALEAVKHLGISVPASAFQSIGEAVIKGMQQSMIDVGRHVQSTATPYDDLAFGLARLPVDALLNEVKKRGYAVGEPVPDERTPTAPFTQPYGHPLNTNPLFFEGVTSMHWNDGRAKDVPKGYTLDWEKFDPNDMYAPPPEIIVKDEYGGMKIELSDRRGTAKLQQSISEPLHPGTRYLLTAHGIANLKLKPDAPQSGYLRWQGRMLDGSTPLNFLSHMEVIDGDFVAEWVIEPRQTYHNLSYQLELVVGNVHTVPFTSNSHIIINAIELSPVDASYSTSRHIF